MANYHPVVVEMFEQLIEGVLVGSGCIMFCFVYGFLSTHDGAWMAGNCQVKVLFENKESQAKGETTVL